MKKQLTMLMLALAGACTLFAAPVSQKRASDIALAFASSQKDAPAGLTINSAEKLNGNLYLVNLAPKGFVIVSADDNAEPIMAFSMTGNLNASTMPANMAYMVDESSQAVGIMATRNVKNTTWTAIETGRVLSRAEGEDVEPLITVNWNQSGNFNKYCPGEGNNKALVGCVAVAMSQAMSVQRFPDRPEGQVSYGCPGYGELSIDFDKEPNYNWDNIIKGTNKYDETAKLLYHAGMSVHMDYGTDGSGIPSNQVNRITDALKNNFGYGNEVTYYWRKNYKGDWEQLILNELYAGRALVYNAVDSKGGYGHSFNLDGFRQGLYHINWGWGGYGNGYFNIDALKDAQMNMNYDSNHVVVVGIGGGNNALKSIQLSDYTIEAGLPAGTPVGALKVNGESPKGTNTTITVTGEWDNVVASYKESPFTYENGMLVTTRPIELSEGSIYVRIQASVREGANTTKLTQGFTVNVETAKPIEGKTSIHYDRTSKMFTVHTKFGAKYTVKNAAGTVVASGEITDDPDFTFSRSLLTKGDNTIEVTHNGQTKAVTIKL